MNLRYALFALGVCFSVHGYAHLNQPAVYYKARGDYYRHLGMPHKALDNYDKAVSLKPDYAECYYWSAVLYAEMESYTPALYQITQAFKYDDLLYSLDMRCDLYFLEITILLRRKEPLQLVEERLNALLYLLQKLDKDMPDDPELRHVLQHQQGKLYFFKGKYLNHYEMTTRLSWIDLSLQNDYQKDHVFYFLYLFYTSYNKISQAKYALDKAIKLNSNIIVEYYKYSELN